MDLNLVIVAGSVTANPEVTEFHSGSRRIRLLVTTRTAHGSQRRLDVIPVTVWDDDSLDKGTDFDKVAALQAGDRVWAVGQALRRFWEDPTGNRRSRIEVVATAVTPGPAPSLEDYTG